MSRKKRYIFCLITILLTIFYIIPVQAAYKQGWIQKKTNWYYYNYNKKVKDQWILYKDKWYYLKPKTGIMARLEFLDYTPDGQRYYFNENGDMATGFKTINKKTYFFKKQQPDMGAMLKSWISTKKYRYYANKKTGVIIKNKIFKIKNKYYYAQKNGRLYTGWKDLNNDRYYFTYNGTYTGWQKINNKYYYFDAKGYVKTGWLSYNNKKYYLSRSNKNKGQRLTGTQTINKKRYYFDKNGVYQYEITGDMGSSKKPGSAKTIKNFLLNAIQPIGNTLYVWGGGWAYPTNTYKGLYPEWKKWFDSQPSTYDFSKYQDLTQKTRSKGLDCAGFVGWTTYNTMHQASGINYGYVVEASVTAKTYENWGWGQLKNQKELSKNNYKSQFRPGDIASMSGHVFIILGQCADNSLVIVHATPPCVQINGTTTPSGNWDSQAILLAKQYMDKYYPKLTNKFYLPCGVGMSYLKAINTASWYDYILADPNNYRQKNAEQILKDLYK